MEVKKKHSFEVVGNGMTFVVRMLLGKRTCGNDEIRKKKLELRIEMLEDKCAKSEFTPWKRFRAPNVLAAGCRALYIKNKLRHENCAPFPFIQFHAGVSAIQSEILPLLLYSSV
jgi:hypothetical protein